MKHLRINGVEQQVPDGILIFEDFLNSLNRDLEKDNKVISTILVNGKELSEFEEQNLKAARINELEDIEILTSNPADLAFETLNTLEIYLDRIILSVEKAAQYYKAKNLIIADNYFSRSIDGMDLFIQTIGGIKLALKVGLNSKVALTEAALLSIMNDLLDAKRNNNYIFLADLLEKDLIENLKEWKLVIFPIFRSLKTS